MMFRIGQKVMLKPYNKLDLDYEYKFNFAFKNLLRLNAFNRIYIIKYIEPYNSEDRLCVLMTPEGTVLEQNVLSSWLIDGEYYKGVNLYDV